MAKTEKKNEYQREWRRANRDKVLEWNRNWRKENRDDINEKKRKWYKKNSKRCVETYMKFHWKRLKNEKPWVKYMRYLTLRCGKGKRYPTYATIMNLLTLEDLEYMWFRDKAYNLKKPALSRHNHAKHYTVSNCKFMESSKHLETVHSGRKRAIKQYSLKGKFMRNWASASDVINKYGDKYKVIYACLEGRTKYSKGYIWKYFIRRKP